MCHETSLKSRTDTVVLVVTRLPPTLNTLLANAPELFKGRCTRLPARQARIRGGLNGELLGSVCVILKFELWPNANTVKVSHKKGTGRLAPGGCHLGPVQE